MTREPYKDELIRQIQCIGESLIRNAESIVGNEEYICNINISANALGRDNIPTICVKKEFLPERYVDGNGE